MKSVLVPTSSTSHVCHGFDIAAFTVITAAGTEFSCVWTSPANSVSA
jgi:hypothetical protein